MRHPWWHWFFTEWMGRNFQWKEFPDYLQKDHYYCRKCNAAWTQVSER